MDLGDKSVLSVRGRWLRLLRRSYQHRRQADKVNGHSAHTRAPSSDDEDKKTQSKSCMPSSRTPPNDSKTPSQTPPNDNKPQSPSSTPSSQPSTAGSQLWSRLGKSVRDLSSLWGGRLDPGEFPHQHSQAHSRWRTLVRAVSDHVAFNRIVHIPTDESGVCWDRVGAVGRQRSPPPAPNYDHLGTGPPPQPERDGYARVSYSRYGNGPVHVLFVCGLSANKQCWNLQIEYFVELNRRHRLKQRVVSQWRRAARDAARNVVNGEGSAEEKSASDEHPTKRNLTKRNGLAGTVTSSLRRRGKASSHEEDGTNTQTHSHKTPPTGSSNGVGGDLYSVLVVDNRGVGFSDLPPKVQRTSRQARDILYVLDCLGWGRGVDGRGRGVHVIGSSMGGMIIQEMCRQAPSTFASVVMSNTHSGGRRGWPPLGAVLHSVKGMVAPTTDPRRRLHGLVTHLMGSRTWRGQGGGLTRRARRVGLASAYTPHTSQAQELADAGEWISPDEERRGVEVLRRAVKSTVSSNRGGTGEVDSRGDSRSTDGPGESVADTHSGMAARNSGADTDSVHCNGDEARHGVETRSADPSGQVSGKLSRAEDSGHRASDMFDWLSAGTDQSDSDSDSDSGSDSDGDRLSHTRPSAGLSDQDHKQHREYVERELFHRVYHLPPPNPVGVGRQILAVHGHCMSAHELRALGAWGLPLAVVVGGEDRMIHPGDGAWLHARLAEGWRAQRDRSRQSQGNHHTVKPQNVDHDDDGNAKPHHSMHFTKRPRMVYMPAAGHVVETECSDAFNRLVLAHVTEAEALWDRAMGLAAGDSRTRTVKEPGSAKGQGGGGVNDDKHAGALIPAHPVFLHPEFPDPSTPLLSAVSSAHHHFGPAGSVYFSQPAQSTGRTVRRVGVALWHLVLVLLLVAVMFTLVAFFYVKGLSGGIHSILHIQN